jgi:hypothetical protein
LSNQQRTDLKVGRREESGRKGSARNTWLPITFTSHVNIRAFARKCCYCLFEHPCQHTCLPFRVCATLSYYSSTHLLHFILITHIAVFLLLSLPITKAIGGTSPNTLPTIVRPYLRLDLRPNLPRMVSYREHRDHRDHRQGGSQRKSKVDRFPMNAILFPKLL